MNCLSLILLALASATCFIAYFYKPWNKPKIIFVIFIVVFVLWIAMGGIEFYYAQLAMDRFKKNFLDGDIYPFLAETTGKSLTLYKYLYYFAILNIVMGFFNLTVSIVGLLTRNRTIYLIGATLFIIEIFVFLIETFITVYSVIR